MFSDTPTNSRVSVGKPFREGVPPDTLVLNLGVDPNQSVPTVPVVVLQR